MQALFERWKFWARVQLIPIWVLVYLSDTDSLRLVHTDTVTQYPVWVYNHELKVSIRRTGLRQMVDRHMLVKVHTALFSKR